MPERASGPASTRPPGALRHLAAIMALPAMAILAVPLAICLAGRVEPGWGLSRVAAAAVTILGAALVAVGLMLVARTIALFARVGQGTLAPWDQTRRLVANGPYRRVRNPMISGVFTVLTGETLMLGVPEMALWTAGFGMVNAIYIPLVEEPRLVKRFGADYLDYKRHVPRWIPRRMPWSAGLWGALCAALLWAGAPAPAGAAPADQQGSNGGPVATQPLSGEDRALSHWTPERMRRAAPLEPLEAPADVTAAAGSSTTYAQLPDQEISSVRDTQYPERIHGRLFVRFAGSDASCSATVVTSRARNVVLTAGHCVVAPTVNGPVWATDVVFAPAYRNGVTPFGVYPATVLRAPSLWSFEAFLELDIGAANLAPGPSGQIEDALGSRGISFNRPPSRYKKNKLSFSLFGYPARPAAFYDGERPILCVSKFKGFEKFTGSPKAGPCNMKEGSSGGGWVVGGGFINSVTSHNACGADRVCALISGTYLGNTAFSLWKQAGGGLSKGKQKKLMRCKKKPKGDKRAHCIFKAERFKGTQL